MQELDLEDQAAADRLRAFLVGEMYRSVAQVLAQSDPSVADALFRRVEAIVATTLRRINLEQAEGPNSTAIVLSVCKDIGTLLKSAHDRSARSIADTRVAERSPGGRVAPSLSARAA
ncbi:hypothetical protein [Methylobacterium radiodurans]|uniref:Uncharacterized protein n=1 Tax=Methylobacterium radiodurans TaxID=2202828 RepID=A0A2U8VQH5_9HYPH|nr:hypothetical protein [Methylobacterium radiodurans]AWN35999.1 hypothetical protein DK427_09895 [Methylobacterium radiodurans]